MVDSELVNPAAPEETPAAAPPESMAPAETPAPTPAAEVPEGEAPPGPEAPVDALPGPEAPADAPPAPEAPADASTATDAPADASTSGEAATGDREKKQRGRPRAKLEDLVPGTGIKGKVVGLAKFGAFVDIGAVTDGLVHITEFSQKRVRRVEDAVQLGDEVDVWIKDVDMNSGRVSLSMRKRPDRPLKELKVGDVVVGTVTSTTKYGVFVDIGAETEGLVHISEMSSGFVERPSDVIGSGASVEVRVKEIDLARERISLSMVGLSNDLGLGAEGGGHEAAPGGADDGVPAEPEERMPTVVELALRRALGEMQDEMDTEDAEAPAAPAPVPERDTLGEMYERMLASYKAEKAQR
jgi:predicted RNA-binding protein with RPS1 domain